MTEKVTLQWTGDQQLVPADGLKGDEMNPKALMLYAGAKCSGLTALMIMQKQRVGLKRFEITVSGKFSTDTLQAESVFTSFHVAYNIECETEQDSAKAGHAASLAHEKHCGLMRMFRQIAPVTDEIAVVTTGK
ncbi:OsmC family protein [uncultured Alistipes sp.]|jgi:predicted redox protein, regulator of disulfide bond formation|uniref:OsmC family protein n=1 Tax=uncultured Alistipes sp. TaxID=538949 RepID=UPI0025E2178F|nr:OsmC family protein [uncultured Alistipes sp.]